MALQSVRNCRLRRLPACSLASKLKTAQVSRERSLQLQERALAEAAEREAAALTAERLERERLQAVAAEDAKQAARRAENFKARDKLKAQSCASCSRCLYDAWMREHALRLLPAHLEATRRVYIRDGVTSVRLAQADKPSLSGSMHLTRL
jgi:hypothetical protein